MNDKEIAEAYKAYEMFKAWYDENNNEWGGPEVASEEDILDMIIKEQIKTSLKGQKTD